MAWSTVGSPGNAADHSNLRAGIGAIPYTYEIGTYDVTAAQYAVFLNIKDPTGTNALALFPRYSTSNTEIVLNPGAPSGNKYSVVAGDESRPVNNVSWFDAIRFANWMNNGQGSGDTETGAYTLGPLDSYGEPVNPYLIGREANARIALPTQSEWYKAAFYDASTRSYFLYPTSSNTPPTAGGPTALANHANYDNAVGSPTDVGAYSGTTSPSGAFDLGGDLLQWTDSRIPCGAAYGSPAYYMASYGALTGGPVQMGNEANDEAVGIRLVRLPEPGGFALGVVGLAALVLVGARRYARRFWRVSCRVGAVGRSMAGSLLRFGPPCTWIVAALGICSMAASAALGQIYVVCENGSYVNNAVGEYTLSGATVNPSLAARSNMTGLAYSDGNLFVAHWEGA